MIREHWLDVLLAVYLCACSVGSCVSCGVLVARAEPPAAIDAETQLVLARALTGEGGNADDHAAIAHLLYRRWVATRMRQRWSFAELITRYCSPLRRTHARARRIQALRWADIPRRIRIAVARFVRGQLRDPCPDAWHFDRRASLRWTRAPRACPDVRTHNIFYRRRS